MWKLLRPDTSAVLTDNVARKSLNRYFAVVEDRKPAKFLVARKLIADYDERDSTEKLWKEHANLLNEFAELERAIDTDEKNPLRLPDAKKSLLDLKIEIAKRILVACHLCMHNCRINRLEGASGYCKCGSEMTVSSVFEHMGEESELVPSGTIFTLGCTMRCKHCQNWTISQWKETGTVYSDHELAREVERLRSNGCRNINLVGGEPTPWLQQWMSVFKIVNINVPVVWNSNAYYSSETAKLLAGFVDVYLLDFKYGFGDCAEKISEAPGYWDACTRNHLEAHRSGETIIRILVLPSHLECCTKSIINWVADNLGTKTRVNLMFQYRPEWRASEIQELRRRLRSPEMDRAVNMAKEAGLVNFIT
jgi:putative pyruvate formate lyase activating enzyme